MRAHRTGLTGSGEISCDSRLIGVYLEEEVEGKTIENSKRFAPKKAIQNQYCISRNHDFPK